MKSIVNKFIIGIILSAISVILYSLHYYFFRDLHHIFLYVLGDIAFLPIEVFLVGVVIETIISAREKKEKFEKLNMVIETFFSEAGKELLRRFCGLDKNMIQMAGLTQVQGRYEFKAAHKQLQGYQGDIDIHAVDLQELCTYLKIKRQFLLGLLQNPNLLEHQSFTEMLLAIFHLIEELAVRDLSALSQTDRAHLKTDAERAYNQLLRQWYRYLEYIQRYYPFLFSFALRTNPLQTKKPS